MINLKNKDNIFTIFKDSNDWNEKSIIGSISFLMICFLAIVQIISGCCDSKILVQEYVFDTFTIIVLGSFGISGIENIAGNKNRKNDNTE
jgi:hypothetical protein